MMAFKRTKRPLLLEKYGQEASREYEKKKSQDPSHTFHWPIREGVSLGEVARNELKTMTQSHCCYCDAADLGAASEESIDHFKPKGLEKFYRLVCEWTNLYLACTVCNRSKREQWDELLLRPDEVDYEFIKYFSYYSDTGELAPNPGASQIDQRRNEVTINVFNLNRSAACRARIRAVKSLQRIEHHKELIDFPYRFLAPLCGIC